jgi:hypothetical protein
MSNFDGNVPFLADFLPEQHSDAYCGAIEDAIRDYPAVPEITAAYAIDRTTVLFRQAWQCSSCGRVLLMGPDRQYYSFAPESPTTPLNILAGDERRPDQKRHIE